jgi:hypothetical protein
MFRAVTFFIAWVANYAFILKFLIQIVTCSPKQIYGFLLCSCSLNQGRQTVLFQRYSQVNVNENDLLHAEETKSKRPAQFSKHNVNKMRAQNLIVRDERRLRDTGNSRTAIAESVRN